MSDNFKEKFVIYGDGHPFPSKKDLYKGVSEEDLYKGVSDIYESSGVQSFTKEEFISTYLEYRDITDINILKTKLDEAITQYQDITRFVELCYALMNMKEEPERYAVETTQWALFRKVKAIMTIELIIRLIKIISNRKDIRFDDGFLQAYEEIFQQNS